MVNEFILQGHITKDLQLNTTTSGISVLNFTIAWNKKYNENETTLFQDCIAWRGTAETINKYFKKGDEIIVEGELFTDTYETDTGEKRYRNKMTVNTIHFTSGKNNNTNQSDNTKNDAIKKFEPIDSDNLPF